MSFLRKSGTEFSSKLSHTYFDAYLYDEISDKTPFGFFCYLTESFFRMKLFMILNMSWSIHSLYWSVELWTSSLFVL